MTSVTPVTWNIIGLDSNTPAAGPNRFPVGARICSSTGETNLPVTFSWDTFDNPYINLSSRAPLADDVIYIDVPSTGTRCADAYFEVVVTQDSAAFDTTREYHITAGGLSTPIPRELYIEHLISQGRNYIQDLQFGTSVASLTSVPAGGGFSLTKGGTYFIRLVCSTATQGYEQLESFTSLPNTVFQILSVATTYSADSTTNVNPPYDKLYGDSCAWENDPDSPNYLACNGEGKIGGSITVTYEVKIIDVRAGAQSINSLIHDFSGSSFHYNSDYLSGGRSLYLIDPANIDISKQFSPGTISSGGVSILTLTLNNPNNAAIDKVKFSDPFPAPMVLTSPSATISNSCGGTLWQDDTKSSLLAAGHSSLYLEGGTIPANGSCTIKVSVTTSAATTTTYKNTTGHVYVDALDTLKFADADLTVDDSAIPDPIPPLTCSVGTRADLARWTFPAGKTTPDPTYDYIDNTDHTPADVDFALARFNAGGGTGVQAIDTTTWTTANSWIVTNWPATNTGYPSAPATGSATWPANHPYFEFEVDSSLYGNVGITFDANLAGNWAVASNNYLYVYSSADGINFTNILVYTPLTKNSAYLNIAATAAATGRARTYFRVNIVGAQGNGTPQSLSLDNIRVSGCPVPSDILPPTIIKAYAYDPVAVNEATALTFTVTNPNSTYTLSEVAFSDALPGGMKVAATPAATTSGCGSPTFAPAANATSLTFSNGSLATNGVCTVSVNVVAPTAGISQNTSGQITAKETGANSTASGFASKSLTALAPPTIAKQFLPNAILTGEVATLIFTLTNSNAGNPLSGVRFTDPLPSGVKVAAPPNVTSSGCGSPTFAPLQDDTTLTFSGGTIAVGGTCKASVEVTAATAGTHTNTSDAVYHTLNSADWPGGTTTDKLYVTAPTPRISLLKQISTSNSGPWSSYVAVNPGANVYYRLTLENIGDVTLSPVLVDDPQLSTAGCVWPATLKAVDDPTNDGNDEMASCILSKSSVIPGDVTNTATASGTFGLTTVQDSASARYATIGLVFTKTPQETKFTLLGETLHYNFVVANTGYAPLAGALTLTDAKTPDESCPGGVPAAVISGSSPVVSGDGDNYLDPGEEVTCTATYQIVQSDIDDKIAINTATATVGGLSRTASATVTYGDGMPLLTILKSASANGGPASKINPGEVITYTVEIENTGAGGASAVTLKDHLSPYVAFGLDSYGPAVGFTVTDSTPPSGLFLVAPQYSADKGANWDHPPASGGGDAPAGYDGAITNWKIPLSGAMRIGGKFILNYQTIVK